jgi:hypothetical protein
VLRERGEESMESGYELGVGRVVVVAAAERGGGSMGDYGGGLEAEEREGKGG